MCRDYNCKNDDIEARTLENITKVRLKKCCYQLSLEEYVVIPFPMLLKDVQAQNGKKDLALDGWKNEQAKNKCFGID